MNNVYFNGVFLVKDQVRISPDDRGFLFADGVYEVVRWYNGFFYDMAGHMSRLKNSLSELNIEWHSVDMFPAVAEELIKMNNLGGTPSMVYLQVTRGAARRTHHFPHPLVEPTVYSYAWGFTPDTGSKESGIKVLLREDIRWSRCNIKSIALLPNTLSFQEATENGCGECIFSRNGFITEGSHSNIFFVIGDTLYTHPESRYILSGITRKNVLRIARESGVSVREEPIGENSLASVSEAFITNTSAEVTPVTEIGGITIGNGLPGKITRMLADRFSTGTSA
jgi:D-alanine transaminase